VGVGVGAGADAGADAGVCKHGWDLDALADQMLIFFRSLESVYAGNYTHPHKTHRHTDTHTQKNIHTHSDTHTHIPRSCAEEYVQPVVDLPMHTPILASDFIYAATFLPAYIDRPKFY